MVELQTNRKKCTTLAIHLIANKYYREWNKLSCDDLVNIATQVGTEILDAPDCVRPHVLAQAKALSEILGYRAEEEDVLATSLGIAMDNVLCDLEKDQCGAGTKRPESDG